MAIFNDSPNTRDPDAQDSSAQDPVVCQSIAIARAGSSSALGELLEQYRGYLLRIAHDELTEGLSAKVAQSDLVQDTFLQASQSFAIFSGQSEWELRGWLRQILLNNMRDAVRHYQAAAKRSIDREVSLHEHTDLARNISQRDQTPSGIVSSEESCSALLAAVARLPGDYRRAIELRSFDKQPFEAVGQVLGRSAGAARKIWSRAIVKLADELNLQTTSTERT